MKFILSLFSWLKPGSPATQIAIALVPGMRIRLAPKNRGFLSDLLVPILIIIGLVIVIILVISFLFGLLQKPVRDPAHDADQSPPPPIVETNGDWIIPCPYCDQNSDL